MNKLFLKTQFILSYASIITALIISLFGLGFMSEFYTLFMNGNDEMYTFFKDLQFLNTKVFISGLTFLVLAFFLIPFDINKKIAGIFGVLLTLAITIINIINGYSIISISNMSSSIYKEMDFSILTDYTPSVMSFNFLSIIWIIAIVTTLLLFILTTVNAIGSRKKGI